jgi:hypothetical protein
MQKSKLDWKTQRFFRMWPRALFHMKEGKKLLGETLNEPGVGGHALKPNWRRYNFWNYFSAFTIKDDSHRDEVEAILISAMPTAANSSKPKIPHMPLDRAAAKLLNEIQALMLTGRGDTSGEAKPEEAVDEGDS